MKNGMRHAHSVSSLWENVDVMTTPMSADIALARPIEPCSHPVRPARRSTGALSTRYAVATPISPPAEKPWNNRPTSRRMGAPIPIAQNGGAKPMMNVPTAMSATVRVSVALRPCVSP